MTMREQRTITELRAVRAEGDSGPGLVGYAAVFNVEANIGGAFIETVAPGAFTNVLEAEPDTRALVNHDPNLVLGRTPKTLRLEQDEHGLKVEVDLPATQVAADLVELVERGDINQMSYAFTVATDEMDSSGEVPKRTITEIGELFDISVVTYPAFTTTEVGLRTAAEVLAYHESKGAEPSSENTEPQPRHRLELAKLKLKAL
jgi:HK97 family phage prohead protease